MNWLDTQCRSCWKKTGGFRAVIFMTSPKLSILPQARGWMPGLMLACLSVAHTANADQALIAAASNFAEPLEALVDAFEEHHPHRLEVSIGSTGKLFAQISHSAPFDVLLAADELRPALLEEAGLAVANSRFTYSLGTLCLWSADPQRITTDGSAAISAPFRRLAMANPDLAPFGVAARETLEALGLQAQVSDRIVMGENVAQAFAMTATGNAELGFVACSLVSSPRNRTPGSHWQVPESMHSPIRQQAVLLKRAEDNPAAIAFLDYLRSPAAQAIIIAFGYDIE